VHKTTRDGTDWYVSFCVYSHGNDPCDIIRRACAYLTTFCIRAGLECIAVRLEPGQDIYAHLREVAAGRSMFVLSCVGSVTTVGLRLAGLLCVLSARCRAPFCFRQTYSFLFGKELGNFKNCVKTSSCCFCRLHISRCRQRHWHSQHDSVLQRPLRNCEPGGLDLQRWPPPPHVHVGF